MTLHILYHQNHRMCMCIYKYIHLHKYVYVCTYYTTIFPGFGCMRSCSILIINRRIQGSSSGRCSCAPQVYETTKYHVPPAATAAAHPRSSCAPRNVSSLMSTPNSRALKIRTAAKRPPIYRNSKQLSVPCQGLHSGRLWFELVRVHTLHREPG